MDLILLGTPGSLLSPFCYVLIPLAMKVNVHDICFNLSLSGATVRAELGMPEMGSSQCAESTQQARRASSLHVRFGGPLFLCLRRLHEGRHSSRKRELGVFVAA